MKSKKERIGSRTHFTKVPGLLPMPTAEELCDKYGIPRREFAEIQMFVVIENLRRKIMRKLGISNKVFNEILKDIATD